MAKKRLADIMCMNRICQILRVGSVVLAGGIGFRERYIFTKHRIPRLRYLIMPVAFMLVAYGADAIASARLLNTAHNGQNPQSVDVATQSGYGKIKAATAKFTDRPPLQGTKSKPLYLKKNEIKSKSNLSNQIKNQAKKTTRDHRSTNRYMTKNGIVIPPASKPSRSGQTTHSIIRQRTIGKGDTIAGILTNAGMKQQAAYHAVKAMRRHYNPRALKPGQNISIKMQPRDKTMDISGFRVNIDPARIIRVARNSSNDFEAKIKKKKTHRKLYAREITISGSLYGSASRNNIPDPIISKAINVFSWDIDFQRDLHRGDTLKILYARNVTEDGVYTGNGTVVYAALDMRSHTIAAYRYKRQDGNVGYFKPNGHSVRKALMATPVDGGRISSGYGKRRHPIEGYTKMHEGVDFAAPTGTPIYAAGEGVIERASRNGGYGNYIRMRHNAHLKTAYAHLNRYADGIHSGKRVKQGEIIGYIGSTGRSTGPHLHYEVIERGEAVNPQNLDMPTGEILEGDALKRFKKRVDEIKMAYSTNKGKMKYAAQNNE